LENLSNTVPRYRLWYLGQMHGLNRQDDDGLESRIGCVREGADVVGVASLFASVAVEGALDASISIVGCCIGAERSMLLNALLIG